MIENIIVREYQPDDDEKSVQLLEDVFRGWPHFDLNCKNVDHWRWKYHKKGFNKSVITLAERNGSIIAVNHSIPVKIKIGNASTQSNQAPDLAIHPDFRKMKLRARARMLNKCDRMEEAGSHDYT